MNPLVLQDVEEGNRTKYQRRCDWFRVMVFCLVVAVTVTSLTVVAYLFFSASPPPAPVVDLSSIASELKNLTITASALTNLSSIAFASAQAKLSNIESGKDLSS